MCIAFLIIAKYCDTCIQVFGQRPVSFRFFACKILCENYIFHVFSEARDHILILNILFFNKLWQIIPEVRSEMWDLLIFIFILKTTGTFTPVHSAGYLILRNEFRSTQEIARHNFRIIFYKQKNEKKLTFLNHLFALDNVFSTKSEEQEVNLVWPNLFLIFDCPYLFIPLMIMISSELCLNEYQWISKLLVKFVYGVLS
jgi:hypothetical protein